MISLNPSKLHQCSRLSARRDVRMIISILVILMNLVFLSPAAGAEKDRNSCLTAPDLDCVETLNQQLDRLENRMQDSQDLNLAKLRRITLLASRNQPDRAHAVLDTMRPTTKNQSIKDSALLAMVTHLNQYSPEYSKKLLYQIKSPGFFEMARDSYISYLVQSSGPDAALKQLKETNRTAHKMKYVAVRPISHALANNGQVEEAIAFIGAASGSNPLQKSKFFEMLVTRLLDQDKLNDAASLLSQIEDPLLRVTAKMAVAAVLHKNRQKDEAQILFDQSRREMASMNSAQQRRQAFDALARSAIECGRTDWINQSLKDLSAYPKDQIDALIVSLSIGVHRLSRIEREFFVDQAIALIDRPVANSSASSPDRNQAWSDLAITLAHSGDAALAVQLVNRITNREWRERDHDHIVLIISHNAQFQQAFDILSRQAAGDKPAFGYIRLAEIAHHSGQEKWANKSISAARALIEGPDAILLKDRTSVMLAAYESRRGHYELAEMRLRHVNDKQEQARGHIVNLGFVAEEGSSADYQKFLTIAEKAILALEPPNIRHQLLEQLAFQLIMRGKSDPAIALMQAVEKDCARDRYLAKIAGMMRSHSQLIPAQHAIAAIASPAIQIAEEHQILLTALRIALDQQVNPAAFKPINRL
ncbi:MAG: hypothetical protein ABJO01_07620 [Parasphingorhabdus sp.]|uniref:tetratricopeptide repeat protein n=1 Tax=Parasphingorhabdus sp. TaxID=2709688 RepID=UPI00329A6CDD